MLIRIVSVKIYGETFKVGDVIEGTEIAQISVFISNDLSYVSLDDAKGNPVHVIAGAPEELEYLGL